MRDSAALERLLSTQGLPFGLATSAPDAAGVYVVWHGDELLYAGMARRLRSRLRAHASGRRSGDQFCVYVCDRFVVPYLTADEQAACAEGTLRLDIQSRLFIHRHLTVAWMETLTVEAARTAEREVRHGRLGTVPLLNPLTAA